MAQETDKSSDSELQEDAEWGFKGSKPAPPPPPPDELQVLDRGAKRAPEPPSPKDVSSVDKAPADEGKMRPQKSA